LVQLEFEFNDAMVHDTTGLGEQYLDAFDQLRQAALPPSETDTVIDIIAASLREKTEAIAKQDSVAPKSLSQRKGAHRTLTHTATVSVTCSAGSP
jgi:hypothetical protein